MKRGIWILNLISQVLAGNLSLAEGLSFGLARIRPKPVSFSLHGIFFEDVDHIFWSILADVFINRVYLPANFIIHARDIVVDIGAHRGGFACFAAHQTSNTVFAFEPDLTNFAQLQKNIKRNNLQNIVARNVAIGGKTGKSRLHISSTSSRRSLYGDKTITTVTKDEAEVDVLSLDDCLNTLESVHLLKMDCEGAEFDILMQASDKTLHKIQKLAVETHDPVHSTKIERLCDRIKACIPNITVIDQKKDNLGYLYAWKPKI